MKRSICLIIIFLAAQFMCALLMTFLLNLPRLLNDGILEIEAFSNNTSALGLSMILSGIIVITAMYLLKWTDRKSMKMPRVSVKTTLGICTLMLSAIFMVNVITELMSLEDLNQIAFQALLKNVWGVAGIVVFGPLSEEFVFRMGIQRHLIRKSLSPWKAIIVSSAVFAVIHGNPAQIPGAFMLGAVLGWLYWRTNNIWIAVAAHAFNNIIGVLTAWLPNGYDMSLIDLCGGKWFTCVWMIIAALLFTASWRYLDNTIPDTRQKQQDYL